jgi:hypothetical protein
MTYHDIQNKDIASASAKSKRRIHDSDSDIDLANQVNSLQRAFANERGINERFREETLAILRILLQRRYPS